MKLFVSYNAVHNLVKSNAKKIRQFNPQVILAIGGGGFVPSRIARTFVNAHIIGVGIQLYKGKEKTEVNVIQWLDQNSLDFMRGKRVLIVDEVDDTRTTLHYCVDRLRNEGISDLGVFVLHFKNKPKKELDVGAYIYGAEVSTDTWIVYPWEADNIEEHDKNCL